MLRVVVFLLLLGFLSNYTKADSTIYQTINGYEDEIQLDLENDNLFDIDVDDSLADIRFSYTSALKIDNLYMCEATDETKTVEGCRNHALQRSNFEISPNYGGYITGGVPFTQIETHSIRFAVKIGGNSATVDKTFRYTVYASIKLEEMDVFEGGSQIDYDYHDSKKPRYFRYVICQDYNDDGTKKNEKAQFNLYLPDTQTATSHTKMYISRRKQILDINNCSPTEDIACGVNEYTAPAGDVNSEPGLVYITVLMENDEKYDLAIIDTDYENIPKADYFQYNMLCLIEGCGDFFQFDMKNAKFPSSNDHSLIIASIPEVPYKNKVTYRIVVSLESYNFYQGAQDILLSGNGLVTIPHERVIDLEAKLKEKGTTIFYFRIAPLKGREYKVVKGWDEVVPISFGIFLNTIEVKDIGGTNTYNGLVPLDADDKTTYLEGSRKLMIFYANEPGKITYFPKVQDKDLVPLEAFLVTVPVDSSVATLGIKADETYMPEVGSNRGTDIKIINLEAYRQLVACTIVKTSLLTPDIDNGLFATGYPILANMYLTRENDYNPIYQKDYSLTLVADTVWPTYLNYATILPFNNAKDDDFYLYIDITSSIIKDGGLILEFKPTFVEDGAQCTISVYYSHENPLPSNNYHDGSIKGEDFLKAYIMMDENSDYKPGTRMFIGVFGSQSCDIQMTPYSVNNYIEDIPDNTIVTKDLTLNGEDNQEFAFALNVECNNENNYESFTLDRGLFILEVMYENTQELKDLDIEVNFYKNYRPNPKDRLSDKLRGGFGIRFKEEGGEVRKKGVGTFDLGDTFTNEARENTSEVFVIITMQYMKPSAINQLKDKTITFNMLTAAYDTFYADEKYKITIPNRASEVEYFKVDIPRLYDWTFTVTGSVNNVDLNIYFCNKPTIQVPLDNDQCAKIEFKKNDTSKEITFLVDDVNGAGARMHGAVYIMACVEKSYDQGSDTDTYTWNASYRAERRYNLNETTKLKLTGGTRKSGREYHYGSLLLRGADSTANTSFAASLMDCYNCSVCFASKPRPKFDPNRPDQKGECDLIINIDSTNPNLHNVSYGKIPYGVGEIPPEGKILYFVAASLISPDKVDVARLYTGLQYTGGQSDNVIYMGYVSSTSFGENHFGYDSNGELFNTRAHFDFSVQPGGGDISISVAPYVYSSQRPHDNSELSIFMLSSFNVYVTTVSKDFLVSSYNAMFKSIREPGMTILPLSRADLFEDADPDELGNYHIYVTVETTKDILEPIDVNIRVQTRSNLAIRKLPYMTTSYTNVIPIKDANSYTDSSRLFHYDVESFPTEITISTCKGLPRVRHGITDYYNRISFSGYATENDLKQEELERVFRIDPAVNGNVDYDSAGRDITIYKYGGAMTSVKDDLIIELNDFDIYARAQKEYDSPNIPKEQMGYAAEVYAATTDARPSIGVKTVRTEFYGSINDKNGTNNVYFSIQFVPSLTSGHNSVATDIEYAVYALPAYFADKEKTKPSTVWWSPYTACGAYYGGISLWQHSYNGSDWMSFEKFEEFHEFNTTQPIPQEYLKGSFWIVLIARMRPDRFSGNNSNFLWEAYNPVLFKDGEIYNRIPHVDNDEFNFVVLAAVLGTILVLGAIAGIVAGVIMSRKKKIAQARMNNYENVIEN